MAKLSRGQIRRLIREAVRERLTEGPKSKLNFAGLVPVLKKLKTKNPKANKVPPKHVPSGINYQKEILDAIGGVNEKYYNMPYYILNTPDRDIFAGSGSDDGTEAPDSQFPPEQRSKMRMQLRMYSFVSPGELSSPGDPYTYEDAGGGKLLVVSGPGAGGLKMVGRTFTPKKKTKPKKKKNWASEIKDAIIDSSEESLQKSGDSIDTVMGSLD